MKRTLLFLMTVMILSSCITKQRCMEKFPPEIISKDSISTFEKIKYKDTTIWVPADSSWLKALLKCDSTGNVYIAELAGYKAGKNVQAPKIVVRDNYIEVRCRVDSMAVYARMKDRFFYREQTSSTIQTVHKSSNLKYWLIGIGILFSVFLLPKAVKTILRRYLK